MPDYGRVREDAKVPIAANSDRLLRELSDLYAVPGWHFIVVRDDHENAGLRRKTAAQEILTEIFEGDLDEDTALAQILELVEADR